MITHDYTGPIFDSIEEVNHYIKYNIDIDDRDYYLIQYFAKVKEINIPYPLDNQ
jgi:hypothetical protein